jgi:putative ABC transport system permease protein
MYRNLDRKAYYRDALAKVESVPGVRSAAFSQYRPQRGALALEPVGRAGSSSGIDTPAETALISPRFFETVGISVLEGRDFTFSDDERSPRVAIISRHLAARVFGEGRGLGERLRVSNKPELQDAQVIGIVSDGRTFDLRGGNLSIVYLPSLQAGRLANFKFLVARAPASAARAIQDALESAGVETMRGMQTMAYWRGRTLLQERVMAAIGGYFGVLALVLVAVGVYGLSTYLLSLRRREIGIRMALGATGARIGRAILVDGVVTAAAGVAVGLLAALPLAGVLQRVLVAVTPNDPIAIVGACGVLLLVTILASLTPAVRASRVEPVEEIRMNP